MRKLTAYLRTGTLLGVVLALCASAPFAAAAPATSQIAAKQAEAAAAQAELDRMNAALEVQVEAYNAITEALGQTAEEIRRTRDDLEQAQADLTEARETLSGRATTIYKSGGVGMLEVFLGAHSFEDFVMRLDLAVRINRSDADTVARVKDAKSRVEASELALEQRQAEQLALQQESASRAAQIEVDVAAQRQFVSRLEGEVQTLIAEEAERQRLLAEERARQAAARAAAGRSGTASRAASDPSSLGAGHPEVVDIAMQYLGVPYVWSGSSPDGFDCSGLTQYCYRQISISIPRTSQSQFQSGKHIARDRLDLLVPGDLVFFGTDGNDSLVHHVGIYVGDGNYLHAPYTGAVVRIDSLTARISSRGDYVGASRF
jgi:cell wall-associated NlpC family hydrolase